MRDTTRIKATAGEALADLERAEAGNVSDLRDAISSTKANLKEIISIATRMDARTGTSDPSTKAKGATT